MINFSVPAMYTKSQLLTLAELNKLSTNHRAIREIYGSIASAPVGTIRPNATLPQVNYKELCAYIKDAKELGLGFNYIMNSTVLDGGEYTIGGKKEILDFVEGLVKAGLSSITITVPFIIRLIRAHFPDLHITASICAEIESVQRANDFEELGVACIVPAKDLNRDFKTLKNMNASYKGKIKLLCTTPCIYKCSDLYYHMNLSSIRDNSLNSAMKVQGKYLSYTASRCQRRRLENLHEYIRSPWIRPEDIAYYEKIGINDFKLDGRDKSEEYNLSVIEAYMSGDFVGNLLYLMQNYYPKDIDEYQAIDEDAKEIKKLAVYMDNKMLDGFIKYFASDACKCEEGCKTCDYCASWSKKVVTTKSKNVDNYLGKLKNAEEKGLSV